jgi:hypothetical protein
MSGASNYREQAERRLDLLISALALVAALCFASLVAAS